MPPAFKLPGGIIRIEQRGSCCYVIVHRPHRKMKKSPTTKGARRATVK